MAICMAYDYHRQHISYHFQYNSYPTSLLFQINMNKQQEAIRPAYYQLLDKTGKLVFECQTEIEMLAFFIGSGADDYKLNVAVEGKRLFSDSVFEYKFEGVFGKSETEYKVYEHLHGQVFLEREPNITFYSSQSLLAYCKGRMHNYRKGTTLWRIEYNHLFVVVYENNRFVYDEVLCTLIPFEEAPFDIQKQINDLQKAKEDIERRIQELQRPKIDVLRIVKGELAPFEKTHIL